MNDHRHLLYRQYCAQLGRCLIVSFYYSRNRTNKLAYHCWFQCQKAVTICVPMHANACAFNLQQCTAFKLRMADMEATCWHLCIGMTSALNLAVQRRLQALPGPNNPWTNTLHAQRMIWCARDSAARRCNRTSSSLLLNPLPSQQNMHMHESGLVCSTAGKTGGLWRWGTTQQPVTIINYPPWVIHACLM